MNRPSNQSSGHVWASISCSEAYFSVCTGQPSARSCDCWRFINKWAWMHLINMLDLGSGNHYKQSWNNNYCKLWLLICVFFLSNRKTFKHLFEDEEEMNEAVYCLNLQGKWLPSARDMGQSSLVLCHEPAALQSPSAATSRCTVLCHTVGFK